MRQSLDSHVKTSVTWARDAEGHSVALGSAVLLKSRCFTVLSAVPTMPLRIRSSFEERLQTQSTAMQRPQHTTSSVTMQSRRPMGFSMARLHQC